MLFSTTQLKEIRQSVQLDQIIGETTELKSVGSYFKGKCPFHDEKTPSFFVYPEKGYYICYGCGERGDIFDFFMKTDGLKFNEAVKKAAEIAGIKLQTLSSQEEKQQLRKTQHMQLLLSVTKDSLSFFTEMLNLPLGASARKYLNNRNLQKDIIQTFQLGFAPDSWNILTDFLADKSKLEPANEVGLIKQGNRNSYYDFFRNRIMFPIIDTSGNIRGFSGRIINPDSKEGKYINSPESDIFKKRRSLFGLKQALKYIRKQNLCILTEGNIDVLSMFQYGFKNTVAPLGTALTEEQLKIIKRYTNNILLLFDGDLAGKKAAFKSIPLILRIRLNAKLAFLPLEHDPDSFLKQFGAEALANLLFNKSLSCIDAFLEASLPEHTASVQEKFQSLNKLEEIWRYLPKEEQNAYEEQIALTLQLDLQDVKHHIKTLGTKNKKYNSKTKKVVQSNTVYLSKDELFEIKSLLYLIVLYENYKEDLPSLQEIPPNLFFSAYVRDLFRNFILTFSSDDQATLARLLTPEVTNLKTQIQISLKTVKPVITFNEILNSLKLYNIQKQTKLLDLEIRKAEKNKDSIKINQLLMQKLNLQKQRNNLKLTLT